MKKTITAMALLALFSSCRKEDKRQGVIKEETVPTAMEQKLNKYVSFKLTSNLDDLSENERQMLPLLIKAADKMNDLFWYEAYGNKDSLLNTLTDDNLKKFVTINYGPWDRLDGNKPFVDGCWRKTCRGKFLSNRYD